MNKHLFAFVLILAALAFGGCNKSSSSRPAASNKVRVGYIGLTCEAPIFTAVEKGFFKEEGLEVELVKCNWAAYKDALALGSFDITHHLVMLFLKPIEQGLDVRFLAGIHRGCLRVQAGVKTNIHTIQDLKGKSLEKVKLLGRDLRDGKQFPRSPRQTLAGYVLAARAVDKCRAVLVGWEGEYHSK